MNFVLVPPDQPTMPVRVTMYPAESDQGPFPIPPNAPIENWPLARNEDRRALTGPGMTLERFQREGTGDRHLIVVDPMNHRLHESWQARGTDAGWEASQASTFALASNTLRPERWTSSDAAGLPIFPAIVRYDEVARGRVAHAMRVTVRRTRREYVYPARHFASSQTDPNLPRMGERLRLRHDFDTSQFPPHARAILEGLKRYGMFVADNGGDWLISIAPDRRLRGLETLARVKGTDFEVIVPTGPDEGPRGRIFPPLRRFFQWFTPNNYELLFLQNIDLSAGGVTLIPDSQLMFSGGRFTGQDLGALDVERRNQHVRSGDAQGRDAPDSDQRRRAVWCVHRSVRQHLGGRMERRQAGPVRPVDRRVDRVRSADLPGELPPRSGVGRRGQHLGRRLVRRAAPGENRQARSEDRPLANVGHPAPRRAAVRSVDRQGRQRLVPGHEPAGPPDGERPLQPEGWNVHVLSAAAVRRRFDAGEPRRGRLRPLHGALRRREGPERLWRVVPR